MLLRSKKYLENLLQFADVYAIIYGRSIERMNRLYGEVLKWPKRRDSKSRRARKRCVGSNPTFSAKLKPQFRYKGIAVFALLCYNFNKAKNEREGYGMSALKLPSQSTKKLIKIMAYLFFIIAYAAFLSIGLECLLNILGISMGISLDCKSPANQYPRFFPFCVIVGLLALVALVLLVILNIKVSERLNYTQRLWFIQSMLAFVVSIPMIKLWEMLFEYMQKVF